jgi:hypothetical protein
MLKRISKDFVVIFGTFFQKKRMPKHPFKYCAKIYGYFLSNKGLKTYHAKNGKKCMGMA